MDFEEIKEKVVKKEFVEEKEFDVDEEFKKIVAESLNNATPTFQKFTINPLKEMKKLKVGGEKKKLIFKKNNITQVKQIN